MATPLITTRMPQSCALGRQFHFLGAFRQWGRGIRFRAVFSTAGNPTLERSKHAVSSIVEASSETQHQKPENQHQSTGNNKTKVVHLPPFPFTSKQFFYPPLPVHLLFVVFRWFSRLLVFLSFIDLF